MPKTNLYPEITKSTSLQDLSTILTAPSNCCYVSKFGTRYLTIIRTDSFDNEQKTKHYELDSIAKKIIKYSKQKLTDSEQVLVTTCVESLKGFYQTTDDQITRRSKFTRCLAQIKDIFARSRRSCITDENSSLFEGMSPQTTCTMVDPDSLIEYRENMISSSQRLEYVKSSSENPYNRYQPLSDASRNPNSIFTQDYGFKPKTWYQQCRNFIHRPFKTTKKPSKTVHQCFCGTPSCTLQVPVPPPPAPQEKRTQ